MFGFNHLATTKKFPPKIHCRKYLTNATIHGKTILVKVHQFHINIRFPHKKRKLIFHKIIIIINNCLTCARKLLPMYVWWKSFNNC